VCGFKVETEALRIPSTKNNAFVGRRFVAVSQPEVQAARLAGIAAFLQERGYRQFVIRRTDRELTLARRVKDEQRKNKSQQLERDESLELDQQ